MLMSKVNFFFIWEITFSQSQYYAALFSMLFFLLSNFIYGRHPNERRFRLQLKRSISIHHNNKPAGGLKSPGLFSI